MSEPPTPHDADGDPPVDLRRVALAVRRSGTFIAAFAAVVTVVVLAVALLSGDRYRSTARIALDPIPGQSVDVEAADRRLATYAELVPAPSVLSDAARRLPGESVETLEGSVSASFDPAVSMLDVVATGEDPAHVGQVANTVAETFVAAHDHPLQPPELRTLGLPVSVGVGEAERELMTLYPQPRGRTPAVEYVPGPPTPGLPPGRRAPTSSKG